MTDLESKGSQLRTAENDSDALMVFLVFQAWQVDVAKGIIVCPACWDGTHKKIYRALTLRLVPSLMP